MSASVASVRLRRHPQAELALVTRREWAFTCPGCDGTYYLRWAKVRPDGSLACHDCDHGDGDGLSWCPGCQRALPWSAFERTPPKDPQMAALRAAFGVEPHLCAECRATPRQPTTHQGTCAHCGETFSSRRSDARYCGGACRVAALRQRRQRPITR